MRLQGWVFLCSGIVAMSACDDDEIRHYRVPKETAAPSPVPSVTAKPPSPLSYTVPAGWTELPASGMRVAAFKAGDAEITVIPLGGAAGSLLANVNRWRGQVGLDEAKEADLAGIAAKITLNGEAATYVDFAGPKGRILAVVLVRGDKTWFFKAQGPAELLEGQRPAFDAFVRSVKFEP